MSRSLSSAAQEANKLLSEVTIEKPPVDPWLIIARMKEMGVPIQLHEQPQDGFEGCTVKNGGKIGIILNSNIPYLPRKRFTLSHEIGHARIKAHATNFNCVGSDIENPAAKRQEAEANEFASELLLPSSWFLKDIGNNSPSFEMIKNLSNERYNTSLTATALKFINLCDEACALVLSAEGRIRWCWKSARWKGYIPSECNLHPSSMAARAFSGKNLPEYAVALPIQVWMPSEQYNQTIYEESVQLPALNQVLTILRQDEDDWYNNEY